MRYLRFFTLLVICSPIFFANAAVILDGSVVSDYVWRGFNILAGDPAFQPSVTYLNDKGITLNTWSSFGIINRGEKGVRDLDEIDLTASYSHDYGDWYFESGFFHLSWYNSEGWPDGASTVNEIFFTSGSNTFSFKPRISINYELNSMAGHDLYFNVAGSRDFIFDSGSTMTLGVSAGYFYTEWIGAEGISDVNLELATSLPRGSLIVSPSFVFTWVPLRAIDNDRFIAWGRITVTGLL